MADFLDGNNQDRLWAFSTALKVDAALFFPTTSHYLEDLRDRIDYDVADERLVIDGFLDAYRVLSWPAGNVVEAATLRKVKAWIEKAAR